MPASMKVSRSAVSLRFCQIVLSCAQTTFNSPRTFVAASRHSFLQRPLRAALRSEAIDLPQTFGKSSRILDNSKNADTRGRAILGRNPLFSLCAALLMMMSYAAASAQTTTGLSISPANAANGSVFTMTATVKAGGTPLTGGTITFRDTYNTITQVLGTVQVQSTNGTSGNAGIRRHFRPRRGGINRMGRTISGDNAAAEDGDPAGGNRRARAPDRN